MDGTRPTMKDARRITTIALWVSDLERSAAFYRDVVGVPIGYSGPHGSDNVPHYETMWNGDGRLIDELDWRKEGPSEPSLWFNLYPADGPPTSGAQIGFPVPDLDAVHARALAADVTVLVPPRPGEYGGRQAIYSDPDGNRVVVAD